jgi:hypothetical protein
MGLGTIAASSSSSQRLPCQRQPAAAGAAAVSLSMWHICREKRRAAARGQIAIYRRGHLDGMRN